MKYKALLIDDEEDILSLIEGTLEVTGEFEIHLAQSVKEAKEKMALNEYNVILSDVNLPDGIGIELLKHSSLVKKAQFLFMTGNQEELFLKEAIKLGACGFIDKPFGLKQVRSQVYKALCVEEKVS